MGNSIHKDIQGVDWPLGNIAVVTPGTYVSIMSLIDAASVNAPETATTTSADEYTRVASQIIIGGFKAGSTTKLVANTGNIYVVRLATSGNGGLHDTGVIVMTIPSGVTGVLGSAALVRNVFDLYRYYIDADNAGDGAQVTALIF
jgi:hypothetical protein